MGIWAQGVICQKCTIRSLCARLSEALPDSWRQVLIDGDTRVGDDAPDFLLCLTKQSKPLTEITTKIIYRTLVKKICQRPAAEKHWQNLFPRQQITQIWENLRFKNILHAVFHTDFKIRHRRIFCGVVLHQIYKIRFSRSCSRCGDEEESLEHLLLECPATRGLREQVRQFLNTACNYYIQEDELEWTWLFGITYKPHNINKQAVNTVLALARHSNIVCRNFSFYENKNLDSWTLFKNNLKWHLKTVHEMDKEF